VENTNEKQEMLIFLCNLQVLETTAKSYQGSLQRHLTSTYVLTHQMFNEIQGIILCSTIPI